MNKILNWTLGSFFRTIGRILCYLVLSFLVYALLSGNDTIKNIIPDIFSFTRVNAAENLSYSQAYISVNQCEVNAYPNAFQNCQWDTKNIGSSISFGSSNGHLKIIQFNIKDSGTYDVGNYRFKFSWSINPRDFNEILDYTPNLYLSFNNGTDNYNNTAVCVSSVGNGTYTMDTICQFGATQEFDHIKLEFEWHCGVNTQCDRFDLPENISSISMNSISLFEYDSNPTNAINQQTEVIDAGLSALDETLNSMNDSINNNLNNYCSNLFNPSDLNSGYRLGSSGDLYGHTGYSTTNYIKVKPNTTYSRNKSFGGYTPVCLYDSNKNFIERILDNSYSFTTTSNTYYIRTSVNDNDINTVMLNEGAIKPYCSYGSYTNKIDDTTNAVNDLNSSINDDSVSGAFSVGSSFFSNFSTSTHGLTGIITAPLNAIQSLTSSTCSPLVLPLPFVDEDLILPCMRPIYEQHFGGFMTLYDIITLGIISYWVMVRIFALVKDFKNPDHDEIEVMDL